MSDQPQPVGFEAYFETKDFEDGIKRVNKAFDKMSFDVEKAFSKAGLASNMLSRHFDMVGDSIDEMANDVQSALDDVFASGELLQDANALGSDAGKTIGDSLLVGLAGAVLGGGGIEKVGAAIGSALGFAIGSSVGGPAGGAIGSMVGGKLLGNVRAAIGGLSMLILGPFGLALSQLTFLAVDTAKFIGNIFMGLGKVIGVALTPIKIVGEFVFNSLYSAAESVFGKIGSLGKQAISELAAEFERLVGKVAELQQIETGLGALVRSALVLEGGFENATEAMSKALPITQRLKDSLKTMALNSPFTIEQINSIFRVNVAFGIALGTSLELTEAMLQFGAATGFGSDSLNLIARNLAQIAKFGQIYRRDIYQLANAGVDLALIVRQELGMSIEELNQELQAGTKSMDDLLGAFVAFARTNYTGAAEDLSKTLIGLQNRFETLKVLVAQDFLTPIITDMANSLDILFDALGMVLQTGVFQSIGEAFASMGSAIVGNVEWTIESVAVGIMELMLWIASTASTMAEYGFGMMEAWGFGMLQGAFQAISAVAAFISSAISALFQTHSPPKILPLIDVWGAETIQAWLEGMTQADFGVLNNIISPIEQILGNLGLDSPDILKNIQNVARMLSESFETGELDQSLLSYIDSISGSFGTALKDLTTLEFSLAQAIKEVAEAQEGLNEATKMYEDADETVRNMVREYNNLLRAGASDEVLDAKLKEIRAAQEQRKEAGLLITEREEELDLAKERQKATEEEAGAQREMLNMMIKLTKSAQDEFSKLGGGGSEMFENLAGGAGDLDTALDGMFTELENRLNGIKGEIELVILLFMQDFYNMKRQVSAFLNDEDGSFQTMLTNMENLSTLFEDVGGLVGIAMEALESWEIFKLRLRLVWLNAEKVWYWLNLIRVWLTNPLDFTTMLELGTKIGDVNTKLDDTEDALGLLIGTTLPTFGTELDALGTPMEDVYNGIYNIDDRVTTLDSDTSTLGTTFSSIWDGIKRKLEDNDTPIKNKLKNISGSFSGIRSIISGMLTKLEQFLTMIANAVLPPWLTRNSPSPIEQTLMGMREHLTSLANTEMPAFTSKLKLVGNANELVNFNPTPTSAFTPSAVSNNSINNTFNMGGNVVRDDMDLAIIRNDQMRTLRQATYGA